MKTKITETLNPEYVKEFSCIGAACEDTCCSGWRVDIDEDTYKKYKRVKNPKIKFRLDKDIIRNRKNPTKSNAAKMKMISGSCSFLNKDGWCDIQINLGEDFLCNTCSVYPRRFNKVNNVIEQSLSVSCPEAARLILSNKDGITFEQGQEILSNKEASIIINISEDKITHWKDFIHEYRYLTILILQNRNYSLEERLLILGMLYNEIDERVRNSNLTDIPDILGQYLKSVEDNTFKGAFTDLTSRIDIQLKLAREFLVLRLNQTITSSRYLECSRAMMLGLNIEKGVSDEEVIKNYEYSYNEFYEPFIKTHGYMLENYLVNYVFKNCMPIDCIAPFESYSRMILHFALIKIHLVGMANHYKGLDSNILIKLVQSLSKTFEHNANYFEKVIELIKENSILDLTYMSILINN